MFTHAFVRRHKFCNQNNPCVCVSADTSARPTGLASAPPYRMCWAVRMSSMLISILVTKFSSCGESLYCPKCTVVTVQFWAINMNLVLGFVLFVFVFHFHFLFLSCFNESMFASFLQTSFSYLFGSAFAQPFFRFVYQNPSLFLCPTEQISLQPRFQCLIRAVCLCLLLCSEIDSVDLWLKRQERKKKSSDKIPNSWFGDIGNSQHWQMCSKTGCFIELQSQISNTSIRLSSPYNSRSHTQK